MRRDPTIRVPARHVPAGVDVFGDALRDAEVAAARLRRAVHRLLDLAPRGWLPVSEREVALGESLMGTTAQYLGARGEGRLVLDWVPEVLPSDARAAAQLRGEHAAPDGLS